MNLNHLAIVVTSCFFLSASATPFDPDFRANRPESLGNGAPVGANGCNLEPVIQLLQGIQCNMNNFESNLTCTVPCAHTPICSATTISAPGAYCLCQDITGVIIIASNDVDLDLNNYQISGGSNGIIVNPGLQRVSVHNGGINNTTDQAIIVGNGTAFITLNSIKIADVATGNNIFAIDFQGTLTSRIVDSLITNISIGKTQAGIILRDTDNTTIEDCAVAECLSLTNSAVGIIIASSLFFPTSFALFHESLPNGNLFQLPGFCENNSVINCTIDSCVATQFSAAGMVSIGAISTRFINNYVSAVSGGFFTLGIEMALSPGASVKDCIVSDLVSTSTFGQTIGLWFEGAPASIMQNCQAIAIGVNSLASPGAAGVFVADTNGAIVKDVLVAEVGISGSAIGFWVDSDSDNTTLINCSCIDIKGDIIGVGFNLLSNNLLIEDCSVAGVTGTSALGYDSGLEGTFDNISILNSDCININGVLEARGFRLNNSFGYLGACTAESITVPPAGGGNISRGYDIVVTSTEIILDSCVANDIQNPVAGEGFYIEGSSVQLQDCTATHAFTGINIVSGSSIDTVVNRCSVSFCSNAGISVLPVSNAVVTNCYATKNLANYIGGGVLFQTPVGTDYSAGGVFAGFNLSA